jgi:hypothetical protein
MPGCSNAFETATATPIRPKRRQHRFDSGRRLLKACESGVVTRARYRPREDAQAWSEELPKPVDGKAAENDFQDDARDSDDDRRNCHEYVLEQHP